MSLENTNKLKATNFVGRGLEFDVSPEQRDLLEMMTPDQRDLLTAQKYYEIRDDKPLTQELTKKIIEQEYGAGATAKLANVENAKPFEHATVFDALEGVTAEPIKLKSSVSDTEDPVDALMDHILKGEGFEKIDITKPYSVSLEEVGVDENGTKVFQEVFTPHFPLGLSAAELEIYLESISTAEGEELEVAQRIEDMPLGRFSASAFNTFFPVDVPTLPAETKLDKVQDVVGAIVGFSALLASGRVVAGDPSKMARGLGKIDPRAVSIPGRAGATGVRAVPGLNTIITKANQHNPVLGRIVENSFNYAAAGGGLGLYSTIGADMTAEQRVEVTLKGAAFGLANVYGRELYALNTVLGKAGAIATVGGTGMALAPEGSTPTERLAYGAVSIVLFGIANGLSNSQATKNAENWMKTQSQNSRSGLSVDNIKYFLSAVFNQQKYARTRTYADRLDLFARQTEATQVKFIPGRPLAEPKKPTAPKPTQKVETLPPATKPAPVPATKKQLPSVADDVELTLAKGREAIKRADELLTRLNQVVNTAPTLANIKQVNKTMTTQQISALAPKVEPKSKGRKLLLNMYNNPTQRNLDAYIKYKYSDLYKPAEELELKPTERIKLPQAEPVQPPVVKMESDVEGVPPPENAQKTQVATTVPTYQKSEAILNDLAPGQTLDFGAGRGKGGEAIGAKTYEPYPREGFSPDFTDSSAIPSSSFEKIISPSVLNVVPKDVRDNIVSEIGRILKPNGAAIITVRSTTDVKKAKVKEKHPSEENAFIVGPTLEQATFQKGFTEKELIDYLSGQLGDGFEVTPIPKVEGKPKPSGVGALIRKSEAAVTEPVAEPAPAGTGIEEPVQVGAGFTQAQRDMELEALRVRDIEKIMGYRIPKDQMDAWDSVIGAARSDGFVDRALMNAQRIIDLNIAHTDKEFVGFLIRAREIQAESSALRDELNEYIADGEDASFLIQELNALEKELNTIAEASAIGGKQAALALQIRRMTLADSYATEDVLTRYIGVSGNNTKEEVKQDLKIKTEKIKELDEEEQQLVNEATRKEAGDALEEIKTGKRKPAKRNKANLEKDIKRGLSEGIIEAAQIYRYFAELVRGGEISKLDQGVKIISKMLPDLTEQEILNAISKRSKSVDAVPEGVELTLKQLRKQARLTAQFNDAVKGIFDPERPTLPSTDEIRHFERAVKMLKAYYQKNLPATAERRKLFDRIRDAEDQVNKHYRNIPLPKKNDPKIKELNKELNTVKNLIAQTDTLYDLELTTSIESKIDIINGMINRDPHEAIDMIRDFVKEINLIYYPRVKHARTPRKEAKPDEKVIPLMQQKIDDLMEELIFQTKTTKPIPEGKPLTTPAQQKKGAELKAAKDAIKLREKVFELSEKLGVKKPAIPLRTTNEQLRDKVNDLNELIKIYNPPTQSQAKKIENLNKRLLEVDKEIEGMYRKYKKPLPVDDPQVVLLRKRLAQETSVRRLLDEIADLEEQLNTGQFKSKYSYKPQLMNKRLDDLRTQRAILKNQVDGAIAKAAYENDLNLFDAFLDGVGSMVLSLDLGQMIRQGAYAWAIPSDIIASIRIGGQSLAMIFKPGNVEKAYAMIRRDQDFGLAKEAKLQLPDPDVVKIGQREELALGRIVGKIPGVSRTSRAQVAGMSLLRFALFKNILRDNPDLSISEMKEMARTINLLTGYGSGELLGRDANFLDRLLISKRFTESRMQIPLAKTKLPPQVGGSFFKGEDSKNAKRYFNQRVNGTIAKNLLLGVLVVEAIPGADFGRNPDHWTFGKIIFPMGGGYYGVVDLFGGVLNFIRIPINAARAASSLAYNTITGRDTKIFGDVGADSWFVEFAKRTHPAINFITRAITGTKYPNEPVGRGEAIARSVSPIIAEEIYTASTERKGVTYPIAEGIVTLLNFFGASTTVLPRKTVFGKNNENVRLPEDIRRLIQF